jgi:hypothetical protein
MTPNTPNGGRVVPDEIVMAKGKTVEGKRTVGLESQTRCWQTPAKFLGKYRRQAHQTERAEKLLLAQAEDTSWPTPASRDVKGANSETHCTETGTGRKHMDQLPNFLAHSPQAREIGTLGQPSSQETRDSRRQPLTVSPPAAGMHSDIRRRLNPLFVEWLMGWPLGWTDFAPVATASFQSWLRMHSCLLRGIC